MSGFQIKNLCNCISSLLVIAFLISLVFLMGGCGAKKKAPDEAVALDPGQRAAVVVGPTRGPPHISSTHAPCKAAGSHGCIATSSFAAPLAPLYWSPWVVTEGRQKPREGRRKPTRRVVTNPPGGSSQTRPEGRHKSSGGSSQTRGRSKSGRV